MNPRCQVNKPKMIALLEPIISTRHAEDFILASKFPFSHRVEAVGFSSGILLLWKEDIEVVILENN